MDAIAREIHFVDVWTPLVPAVVFVLGMSLVREPARLRLSAVFAAGFATLYVNGGLGAWEFAYMGVATIPAYLGQRSYTWVGVAWALHTGWDLVHHFHGNPLWHWQEMSSFGCAILDAAVALWYFAGAPSVYGAFRRTPSPST